VNDVNHFSRPGPYTDSTNIIVNPCLFSFTCMLLVLKFLFLTLVFVDPVLEKSLTLFD